MTKHKFQWATYLILCILTGLVAGNIVYHYSLKIGAIGGMLILCALAYVYYFGEDTETGVPDG